jgi:hypothetical protein
VGLGHKTTSLIVGDIITLSCRIKKYLKNHKPKNQTLSKKKTAHFKKPELAHAD